MSEIRCKECRVNKYCGTNISCEQTLEIYQQGRADERKKIKDILKNELESGYLLEKLLGRIAND